jgi:aminotransferase
MPGFSKIVQNAEEAMSVKYNNQVYDLKRNGVKVIVLSLGEAFFNIPLFPMDDLPFPQIYHYSHSRGILELREKIGRYYADKYDVPVDPEEEIIITAGSKAAIYFAMMSTLDPGDEVIMHEPMWVSYPEQVHLCYAKSVFIPYNETIYDYKKYITDRTKLLIVNNPHNPRGQNLTHKEITYLVDLVREYGIYLLADEAYSDFVLNEKFNSAGAIDPKKENVIVCNSLSKSWGLSGWRLGYIIADKDLIYQVLKINQHLVTCPATILECYMAQYFDKILQITKPQLDAVVRTRGEIAEFMDSIELNYLPGTTTFYFFVSISPSRLGSEEFCTRLLMEEHISVVPGVGYGGSCDSFVRVSVGTETVEDIKLGLRTLKELIVKTSV